MLKKSHNLFDTILIAFGALISLLYTQTISNDYYQYDIGYKFFKDQETFLNAIAITRFEPGFVIIYFYLSKIFSFFNLFLLISSICIIIKFLIFKKFLKNYRIAWLVYLIIFLPSFEANQIRMAIVTIFIIYILCSDNQKIKYFRIAFLASSFHLSGLLILFFKFHLTPIKFFLIFLFTIFSINNIVTVFEQILPVDYNILIPIDTMGQVNILNSNSLVQFIMIIYIIIYWKKLSIVQKKGALLICAGLIFFVLMDHSAVVAHRIRETSLLGIFPLIFSGNRIILNHFTIGFYISIIFINSYFLWLTISELIQYLK
tara:strand:- start:169 stop:1116 length:948 start_codon:yes stop_codon:yes gene_type:complete